MEIERTFFISSGVFKMVQAHYPCLKKFGILQGYTAIEKKGNEVRIRRKKKGEEVTYSTTTKSYGARDRGEYKHFISKRTFEELFLHCVHGRWFRKKKFIFRIARKKVFFNVYEKPLHIIIAEVEFRTRCQAEKFIPPDFFGKEVTEIKKFRGRNLAVQCATARKKKK